MFTNLIVASVFFIGLAMTAMSANSSDANNGPNGDRTAGDPPEAPCDPRVDPGCESSI